MWDDILSFFCAYEVSDFVLIILNDLIFVVHEIMQQIQRDTLFMVHVFIVGWNQLADLTQVIGGQLLQSCFVSTNDFGVQLAGDQLVFEVVDDGGDESVEVVQDEDVLVAHEQQKPLADALERDDQLTRFLFQVTHVLVDLRECNLV